MQKISQCLWFDNEGEEAARFYTSVFKNSKIIRQALYGKATAEPTGKKEGSVMTVEFQIENLTIMALNGGPDFKFTPALSFFVWCESEKEIDELWKKLSQGGQVRMGLDKYPWAPKYGFTADKFGVNWQLILVDDPAKRPPQKIATSFLFVDKLFGKGEAALNFYTSIFKNAKTEFVMRDEAKKTISHAIFNLAGQKFVLMEGDGHHGFTFNNAFSLMVLCDTQSEIDECWSKLTEGGGSPGPCGWLTDKFGVSWQIVPSNVGDMMCSKDRQKAEKAAALIMKMTKLDKAALEKAFNG